MLNLFCDSFPDCEMKGVCMRIVKGVVASPRRILLYGPHGVGKGTWASQSPSPIFLDVEGGLDNIDCERTERLGTIDAVSESLTWLLTNDHDYKTIVIDTIDWVEQLMHKKIASDERVKTVADIGYGKGYARAVPMWQWIISQLDELRTQKKMSVILLGHAKIERYESPETESYDRYSVDLHKQTCGMVQEWCDEVLFANFRVFTKKQDESFNRKRSIALGGKERFIRTSESAACLAKNRLDLPEEMPLEWSVYESAINAYHQSKGAKPPSKVISGGNVEGLITNGSSKHNAEFEEECKAAF
jgi:hypothetical protein